MRTRAAAAIGLAAIAGTTACSGGIPCDVELMPGDEMPDLDMQVGDTVETDLRDHFWPRNCLVAGWPRWGLRSSDLAAVSVSVSAEHVLTTAALAVADSVLVTVSVEDTVWTHHDPEFVVRVRPAGR